MRYARDYNLRLLSCLRHYESLDLFDFVLDALDIVLKFFFGCVKFDKVLFRDLNQRRDNFGNLVHIGIKSLLKLGGKKLGILT